MREFDWLMSHKVSEIKHQARSVRKRERENEGLMQFLLLCYYVNFIYSYFMD